jgi:hypothetical protein
LIERLKEDMGAMQMNTSDIVKAGSLFIKDKNIKS